MNTDYDWYLNEGLKIINNMTDEEFKTGHPAIEAVIDRAAKRAVKQSMLDLGLSSKDV